MQLSGLLMVPAIFSWWHHSDLCLHYHVAFSLHVTVI